jgi:hypothetical protein
MAKATRWILSFAPVMLLASILWAQDNPPSKTTSAKAPATAKQTAPAVGSGTKLLAAVCKIDPANRTVRVVPWDGKTWKRDSLKVLGWNDQTQLTSGAKTLTMPQFIGGKPLDDESKDVAGIQGERGVFYIQTNGGKEVVTKVEMMALFGGESLPGMIGNNGFQIVGGTKVSCGDGTSGLPAAETTSSGGGSPRSSGTTGQPPAPRGGEPLTAHIENKLGVAKDIRFGGVSFDNPWNQNRSVALELCVDLDSFCLETEPNTYIAIPYSSLKEAHLADGQHTVILTNGKTLVGKLPGTISEEGSGERSVYNLSSITSLTLTGFRQGRKKDPASAGARTWHVLGTHLDLSTLSLKNPRFGYFWADNSALEFPYAGFEVGVGNDVITASIGDFSELTFETGNLPRITVTSLSGVKTVGSFILRRGPAISPATRFALVADIEDLADSTLILLKPNCTIRATAK